MGWRGVVGWREGSGAWQGSGSARGSGFFFLRYPTITRLGVATVKYIDIH